MAANSHEIPFKLDQGNDDGVIKLIFFAFKNREFNNHEKKNRFRRPTARSNHNAKSVLGVSKAPAC